MNDAEEVEVVALSAIHESAEVVQPGEKPLDPDRREVGRTNLRAGGR